MEKAISVKVTPEGVLVPHPLVRALGDVQEVEIEQRTDSLVIKAKVNHGRLSRDRIVGEMKAVGLIEDLPWDQPPEVPAQERKRLAEKLSVGEPLSEIIIQDREEDA